MSPQDNALTAERLAGPASETAAGEPLLSPERAEEAAQLLDILTRRSGWSVGHLFVPTADGTERMVDSGVWSAAPGADTEPWRGVTAGLSTCRGLGLVGSVWQSGESLLVNELDQHVAYRRSSEPGGSCLAFPVRHQGRVVAVVELLDPREHVPEDHFVPSDHAAVLRRLGRCLARSAGEEARAMELALSASGVATWHWDIADGAVRWNDAHFTMLGYGVGQVQPSYGAWLARVHPADADRVDQSLRESRERRTPYHEEFRSLWPDGTVHWLEAHGQFVFDERGRAVRLAGIMADQTCRREREAKLRAETDELEREGASKDAFIAMLGHELSHPLTGIRVGAELLARETEDLEAREVARRLILQQAEHMTCLLSDLMDHAMAARRQLTLHLTAVSLRELVERVVMPYRYGVDGKRHPVEVEVPASLAVVADRLRLEQVLSNLVSNASRYSEDGSPIRVSARSAGTEVFVTVSDRGCGLTPDEAQGIFDPLARRARQHGRGLGLGLALVKRIVELHGGRVSVKSDGPGQGSEFGFALTLAQAATRAADASNVSGDDAPERSSEGSAAVGLRVCLVDDDERTGAAVGELLEVAGCERTWVCTSAGEALALLERPETEVDVILTDIALAGRDDGCQLAREVRARAGAGCPGLVAFTGHDPRMEGDDRASAFDAIIIKPASIEEILSVLGAVVGKAGAG